jgi:hypothetical protein
MCRPRCPRRMESQRRRKRTEQSDLDARGKHPHGLETTATCRSRGRQSPCLAVARSTATWSSATHERCRGVDQRCLRRRHLHHDVHGERCSPGHLALRGRSPARIMAGSVRPRECGRLSCPLTLTLNNPTTITQFPSQLTGAIASFIPGQSVTVRLDDPTSGTVLPSTFVPTTVAADGAANLTVTEISSTVTNGTHTLYAIGNNGDLASATFTVQRPRARHPSPPSFSTVLPSPAASRKTISSE